MDIYSTISSLGSIVGRARRSHSLRRRVNGLPQIRRCGLNRAVRGALIYFVLSGCIVPSAFAQTCVFVANEAAGTISVIDRRSLTVVGLLGVGQATCGGQQGGPNFVAHPTGLALAHSSHELFVKTRDCAVFGLQLESSGARLFLPVPGSPIGGGLAVTPDGFSVFTIGSREAIAKIDTDTKLATAIPSGVYPLAYTSRTDGSVVYAANLGDLLDPAPDSVSVVDAAAGVVVAAIEVANGPTALVLSPDQTLLFVGHQASGIVSVVDLASNAVTRTLPIGGTIAAVQVFPDGATLLVSGSSLRAVSVATGDIVDSLTLTSGAAAITPDGRSAFTITDGDTVTVVDLEQLEVETVIPLGDCLCESAGCAACAPSTLLVGSAPSYCSTDVPSPTAPVATATPTATPVQPTAMSTSSPTATTVTGPASGNGCTPRDGGGEGQASWLTIAATFAWLLLRSALRSIGA